MASMVVVVVVVVVVILASITAFLCTFWQYASSNACRLCEALQEWQGMSLSCTAAWRVRELLAHLWWLGGAPCARASLRIP